MNLRRPLTKLLIALTAAAMVHATPSLAADEPAIKVGDPFPALADFGLEGTLPVDLKGKLVIVDLLPHDREDFQRRMGQQSAGFALDEARRMLLDAGFDAAGATPLPPAAGARGPALFLATGLRKRLRNKVS